MAETNRPNRPKKVVGVFELVSFPDFSSKPVIAKLDTGAYSGALHCSAITERTTERGKVLEFVPLDLTEPVQSEEFAISYVKSSNGLREKRYFIDTKINLAGEEYEIVLSLTKRDHMKWQILIGRRFLSQHGFVVDARRPRRVS